MRTKLRNAMTTVAALGFAAAILPARAYADWTVCNRSPYDVNLAIAFDEGGEYVSQGWWKVAGCGCRTILRGNPSRTGAFVHARNGGQPVLKGSNFLFCVSRQGFRFKAHNQNRELCTHAGGRFEDFQSVTLQAEGDTETNIVGRKMGSRVCID